MQSQAQTVDDYLETIPEERRAALAKLRAYGHGVLTGYDESMNYNMPTYTRDEEMAIAFARWIGKRQWEGLPGEFDVGQAGWVYPKGEPANVYIFSPAFGSESAWSYQVPCVAENFLRFTTLEHA